MKIISHIQPTKPPEAEHLDEGFPYPFLGFYSQFEQSQGNKVLLLCDSQGICAPLRVEKRMGFHIGRLLFPPLSKEGHRLELAGEKSFWEKVIAFCQANKICDTLEQPILLSNFKASPEKAQSCPFGYYHLPLQGRTEEDIFGGFQKRYRGAIRTARRKGAVVEYGFGQMESFYQLHKETSEREKTYFHPLAYFDQMKEQFTDMHLMVAVAYHQGQAQGSLLAAYTRHSANLLYAGAVPRPSDNGIIKLLHWEVIKALKATGCRELLLGGSRLKNTQGTKWGRIQKFKERFGAENIPGVLWKKPIHPVKGPMYRPLLGIYLKTRGMAWPKDLIDSQK